MHVLLTDIMTESYLCSNFPVVSVFYDSHSCAGEKKPHSLPDCIQLIPKLSSASGNVIQYIYP